MRRRAPIIVAVTTAGLLALGGAAYAGGTGTPQPVDDPENCTATQASNLVAVGGVCPVIDPDTILDPDTIVDLDDLVRLD